MKSGSMTVQEIKFSVKKRNSRKNSFLKTANIMCCKLRISVIYSTPLKICIIFSKISDYSLKIF